MNKFLKVIGLAVLGFSLSANAQDGNVVDTFFSGQSQGGGTNKFQVFIPANDGKYAAVTSFGYFFDVLSDPVTFKAYTGKVPFKVTAAASAGVTNFAIANPLFATSAGITTNDVVIIPDTGGYILRTVTSASATNIGTSAATGRALTTSDKIWDTDNGITFSAPNSQNGTNDIGFTQKWFFPGGVPHCIEGVGTANGLKGRGHISGYIAK